MTEWKTTTTGQETAKRLVGKRPGNLVAQLGASYHCVEPSALPAAAMSRRSISHPFGRSIQASEKLVHDGSKTGSTSRQQLNLAASPPLPRFRAAFVLYLVDVDSPHSSDYPRLSRSSAREEARGCGERR